ncbi:UDP-glucuronosyltransferase 2A1-like isoform X1 [Cynoglossus semilaevis]|uniref:UDP-glucuronosyltransferase n=1 Tax=Cynoglossus semilaevis TaxID=244447 RepID=A0A3P8WYK9_CYNSE|nr:UDP-glucuronosyltransferase 2A1-like isoform X1 [Cynoglossus semilaevis]
MKQFLLPSVLIVLLGVGVASGGHVLVFPGEYSHWLNMRSIMDELVRRNHSVTVLVSDASPSINYNDTRDAAKFNFIVFKVPFSRAEYHAITEDFIHFSLYESAHASIFTKLNVIRYWFQRSSKLGMLQCDAMLKNQELMATLRDARFDVVLLDPMIMCGDLVADVLDLPLIISLRFSFGNVIERHCGHAIAPPSYVPSAPLPYSDNMTFMERVVNVVTYMLTSAMTEWFWSTTLDKHYSEIKGRPSSVCESLGRADIWLIRTFWDIETPRPILPNFKYVGGLHCKPGKPLPDDLEAFYHSSGDAGVVVVSFGSMVANLTAERTDVIAAALGRIPQKVIWRYKGAKPKTLAANTKILDWIPQNDLLADPQTRAFVTHGGTNGLYEAVYHAVPLVGVPLFGDQPDNLARLSRRGAAIVLDIQTMTSDELTEALDAVINQPSYKASMQHLSTVHRDRPLSALDTAVFWVEFVMRNGDANHLRPSSHDLNLFQYHSLDVIGFLLVVIVMSIALCWSAIKCVCQSCRRTRREKTD